MYLSNKIHVVSTALMCVGIINILAEAMNILVRKISAIMNPAKLVPDMLYRNIWMAQSIVALLQLIANAIVFYIAYKKTKHYLQLIPTEDAEQMALLQKETNNEKISQLNIRDIYNLLMVWTAITLGVQFVYEITSLAYKKFIAHMLISVVWTSVIFHLLQTGGIMSIAVYLRLKFKGM